MNAKNFGRLALITIGLAERGLDEFLFKCPDSLVEKNSFLNHLRNKGFQLLSHNEFLS